MPRSAAKRRDESASDGHALTYQEVANELGVHALTVKRLVYAGRLRAFRVGKAVRIERAALDEFLAAGGTASIEP